jgi:hypothetical protein
MRLVVALVVALVAIGLLSQESFQVVALAPNPCFSFLHKIIP